MAILLSEFPTDISLYILSFLTVQDLRLVQLISRQTRDFIHDHKETIYHQSAILHCFAKPGLSLEEAKKEWNLNIPAGGTWLAEVRTWRELCKRLVTLERNWDGRGSLLEGGGYGREQDDSIVHFRVDDDQQVVLVMTRYGGLISHALEDNRVLWVLRKEYLPRPTCRISHGFLAFPSRDSGIEIWRRSSDLAGSPDEGQTISTPLHAPSPFAAQDFQFEEARLAARGFPDGDKRGQYTPHAYIGLPYVGIPRLYHLRYPVLAVLNAVDFDSILLFDVRDGSLIRRVSFSRSQQRVVGAPANFRLPRPENLGWVIMDIEVSDKYIAVATQYAVIIFSLYDSDPETGQPPELLVLADADPYKLVQEIAMRPEKIQRPLSDHVVVENIEPLLKSSGPARVAGVNAMEAYRIVTSDVSAPSAEAQALVHGPSQPPASFLAARFSPDGRHLAALTAFGILYLVPDFARVEKGAIAFSEITKRIHLGDWMQDLIWEEQQRRLLVKTASEGVFLINLDTSFHSIYKDVAITMDEDPFANILVLKLADFDSTRVGWARGQGSAFKAMQMTRTALWMVWDITHLRCAVRQRASSLLGTEDENSMPEYIAGFGSVCFMNFLPDA